MRRDTLKMHSQFSQGEYLFYCLSVFPCLETATLMD